MKQPTIMYEGVECKLLGIDWYSDNGKVAGVTFNDATGKFHCAHEKMYWDKDGYDENNLLHMDIEKALKHNERSEAIESVR